MGAAFGVGISAVAMTNVDAGLACHVISDGGN